jgi:hypothetical protein
MASPTDFSLLLATQGCYDDIAPLFTRTLRFASSRLRDYGRAVVLTSASTRGGRISSGSSGSTSAGSHGTREAFHGSPSSLSLRPLPGRSIERRTKSACTRHKIQTQVAVGGRVSGLVGTRGWLVFAIATGAHEGKQAFRWMLFALCPQ